LKLLLELLKLLKLLLLELLHAIRVQVLYLLDLKQNP
jgi:hypothetical protein